MSLVCPQKVCLQVPSLRSHSLARESQAPDTKVFSSAERARDMQSPMWLVKMTFCLPVSKSHRQLERGERKSQGKKEKIDHIFNNQTNVIMCPRRINNVCHANDRTLTLLSDARLNGYMENNCVFYIDGYPNYISSKYKSTLLVSDHIVLCWPLISNSLSQ